MLSGIGAAALLLAACSSGPSNASHSAREVVTFAEQPSAPPNYIFPLESGAYFTFANGQFVPLMYLPLYWFGNAGKPSVNYALSIAEPPTFADNNSLVTITLKHWLWSDGKPITARDVIFWLNLLSAATDPNAPPVGSNSAPGPGWGAAVPGGFPLNVVRYTATGTYSVTMKLNASYNPTWFLYNELSQITPIPTHAWDRLASGSVVGNYDAAAQTRVTLPGTVPAQYVPRSPGSASTGALGVAEFLNLSAQDLGTYSSNPLWKVVDGPFELRAFNSSGFAKFVPNPGYSGSPKAKIGTFEELPFTTDAAELNGLLSGTLTIGYVPPQDFGSLKGRLETSGGYNYSPWYNFGFNGLDLNFTNPSVGPIFSQLYFRQALQYLINQPQYISKFYGGVATPSNGPVPTYPPRNSDLSPLVNKGLIYPYDPAKSVSILRAHGWNVPPQGTTTCTAPGTGQANCGAGIRAGTSMTFTLLYPSGSAPLTSEMEALQSTAREQAGIDLSLSAQPVNAVTAVESAGCTTASPCSNWDMSTEANTGVSWVYLPDYYPTGGEIFLAGAGSNHGDYSSSRAAALILSTHTAASASAETAALYAYENYIAQQLPELWLPTAPYQLTMYKRSLRGVVPQGIFSEIYPQQYTYAS